MNKMELLTEWETTINNSSAALEALYKALGVTNGPLVESIYTMQATYTKAMSIIVGDHLNWLEWFACENAMGASGLKAAAPGKPMKAIKTIKQILAIIEAMKAEA